MMMNQFPSDPGLTPRQASAKGVVTNIIVDTLSKLTPFGSIVSGVSTAIGQGEKFAEVFRNGVCGVIGESYQQYTQHLWFEAQIDKAGNPVEDGYHCGQRSVIPTNQDFFGEFRNLLSPNGKLNTRPDFIIKQGGPESTDFAKGKGSKSYLLGDFKLQASQAYTSITKSARGGLGDNQWKTFSKYAAPGNNHEYAPVILYLTLFGEKSPGHIQKAEEEALRQGRIVFIQPITPLEV